MPGSVENKFEAPDVDEIPKTSVGKLDKKAIRVDVVQMPGVHKLVDQDIIHQAAGQQGDFIVQAQVFCR